MIEITVIVQALIVAGVTAIVTGYVNGLIIDTKLTDLADRVKRIEHYLNGLLSNFKDKK